MKPGMVSVVVPLYNKASFLRETLDAVLAQEGVPLEVIVVDDASTDGGWEIVSDYADRIVAHRLPENRGGPHARNHGARLAAGEFLMFLDADDLLAPGTLAALARALPGREGCVAACRWKQMKRQDGEWITYAPAKPLLPPDGDYVRAWLNDNWYFPPCAVLWPRALYEGSGGWDEGLRVLQDADIMVRMLLRGTQIVVTAEGEARYRVHEAGGSVSKASSRASVQSRMDFLGNAAREADGRGLLSRYSNSIGRAYYTVARTHAVPYPDLVLACLRQAERYAGRTPFSGSPLHRVLWRILGPERKERVSRWLARRGLFRRSAGTAAEA